MLLSMLPDGSQNVSTWNHGTNNAQVSMIESLALPWFAVLCGAKKVVSV